MAEREKLMERARDELFSHINRCGVLRATEDDQRQWMDETIEYVGERYPDLSNADLRELHAVGIRFCKPAIAHGRNGSAPAGQPEASDEVDATADVDGNNTMTAAEDANAA